MLNRAELVVTFEAACQLGICMYCSSLRSWSINVLIEPTMFSLQPSRTSSRNGAEKYPGAEFESSGYLLYQD